MTNDDVQYKRISREEAFNRDPFDTTPVEYEDEVTVGFTNFETGETTYKVVKGIARLNAKPSAAIRAYYARLRRQQDDERRESA
jgi:hypothetical protein